ncbi:MAG: hypothetical protein FJ086_07610 [Deltaproteobacteria bacterium]|nr:hypothetical protein [Deltaproteobacteria bacterium]
MSNTWGWAVGAVLAAVLAGCPQQGVVCQAGTARCGSGCADFSADVRNCGACGNACATGQECSAGACVCAPGTAACDGACVVTTTDARHCGGCGKACAPGDVCSAETEPDGTVAGTCQSTCTGGKVQCGQGCVDLDSDAQHCGACGNACDNQRSCRDGVCAYDVVLACSSFGQVAGLRAADLAQGPKVSLGSAPAALGRYGDGLLVADSGDRRLYQLSLGGHEDRSPADGGAPAVGSIPNQVVGLQAEGKVLVANGDLGTLQVLSAAPLDGGAGLALQTVGEVNLGENSFPQGVAVVDGVAWVTLYGGFDAQTAAAGQKVVPVDLATLDAGTPVDLSKLDLKPFDGQAAAPLARPMTLVPWNGKLYGALNNLDIGYVPAGPGMVVELDPQTRALAAVDLGAVCLNATSVVAAGDALYVACTGKVTYAPPTYAATAVEKAGVVKLGRGASGALERLAAWSVACPANGGDCPVVGRLAVTGGRVFVTDQAVGRLFVLSAADLSELSGFSTGGPVQACPAPDGVSTFSSYIGDVLAP